VLGILLGYLISYLFATAVGGWRLIYIAASPVAIVSLVGMYALPPSPRWLLLRNKPREDAVNALKRLRPNVQESQIEEEVDLIQAGIDVKSDASVSRFGILFERQNLRPLVIGLSLMVFQQITGQPSVLYYSTKIFQEAGFEAASSATAVSVLLGIFKLVMTGVAVFTVDVVGRRPLLLSGVIGMVISLFILGSVNFPVLSVIALLLYVGCYQVSFGPISWLLVGEVFPLAVRSSAIAIASFANFGSNFLVSLVLPSIQSSIGVSSTYLLFGLIGMMAIATIYFLVPETKGKTLEEIEQMFK